jgi:ribosomal protein S18 acetylase RimI-like enzyme
MTQQAGKAIAIRAAVRDDFPALARLIARQNERPESQCIHSGEGYESILQTMIKWDEADEFSFAVALRDGHLVGASGCEFDESLGRGWLWGPFALTANWDELANTLLDELLALLPPAVSRLDFFLNEANQRAYDLYLSRGFGMPKVSHVYVAPRPPTLRPLPESVCPQLEPRLAGPFADLHDAIFPNTYYTGRQIIDQLDGEHRVFVCVSGDVSAPGDEVWGYIYAIIDESAEGYVEYLGVRSDRRGQGLGKCLLLTALDWLFRVKNVSEVGLTVSDDQANARSLYEQVGFRIRYTGLSARKDL